MESEIRQTLTQFISDQFDVELPSTGADLIEAGILDSFMLIEVVMFMETEFSVTIELDDLEMENFVSVDSMAHFVAARRTPSAPAGNQASPAVDERGT